MINIQRMTVNKLQLLIQYYVYPNKGIKKITGIFITDEHLIMIIQTSDWLR